MFGVTMSYRSLRDGIRKYYRDHYPLMSAARRIRHPNPGAGLVSLLCHEPRVAVAVIEAMLAPARSTVHRDRRPASAGRRRVARRDR
jgi:hypothetical protein